MAVKPLTRTYQKNAPYVVERHDQDDGTITYEVWDHRPESYRRLCSINEHYDSSEYSDEDRHPKFNARADADMIVHALNSYKE